MSNETKYNISEKWVIYIISSIIGIFVLVCSLLAFAAVCLYADLAESFSSPLASVSAGLGAFTAGFLSSRKIGSGGIINGAMCALLIFALMLIISAIIIPQVISVMSLYHGIIMVLSGAIGGIVGANMSARRKII